MLREQDYMWDFYFYYAWFFKRCYGCLDRNKWASNCFEVRESREVETDYALYNTVRWSSCDLEVFAVGVGVKIVEVLYGQGDLEIFPPFK